MIEFNLIAFRLAQDVRIPQARVAAILKGKRCITTNTALQLGRYFGTLPKFWLGFQNDYDLKGEQLAHGSELAHIQLLAREVAGVVVK